MQTASVEQSTCWPQQRHAVLHCKCRFARSGTCFFRILLAAATSRSRLLFWFGKKTYLRGLHFIFNTAEGSELVRQRKTRYGWSRMTLCWNGVSLCMTTMLQVVCTDRKPAVARTCYQAAQFLSKCHHRRPDQAVLSLYIHIPWND